MNVFIDGQPLTELVKHWELTHCPEPDLAGRYLGLFDWEHHELKQWEDHKNGALTVLGCTCGTAGCWPLVARVRTKGEQVIWDEFRQMHRQETWPYDGFGPFTFHRRRYFGEVQRALAEWTP